jgi:6-phosphogluconolactonase
MRFEVAKDTAGLGAMAADWLVRSALDAIARQGRFDLALSGGATPKLLYQTLLKEPMRSQVDWGKVRFFWSDERMVARDHPDSNYRLAHVCLLAPLGIGEHQQFPVPTELSTPAEAATAYARILEAELAHDAAGNPWLDCVLLGMGADGHTASLFHDSDPAMDQQPGWVAAVRSPSARPPVPRITLTLRALQAARRSIFMVSGAEKHRALKELLPLQKKNLPAGQVRSQEVIWLVDRAAWEGRKD